jgi:uncharacterized protein (DUF983 family)
LERSYPPLSPFSTGFAGRCPRCGDGRLFEGFVTVAPTCDVCGLDYAFADSGDGPAVFVILFAGFVVLGGALAADLAYDPPVWLLIAIFAPLTLVVCLGLLRPLKGFLIASQYVNRAAIGRRIDS